MIQSILEKFQEESAAITRTGIGRKRKGDNMLIFIWIMFGQYIAWCVCKGLAW
jgi:hypothetical protein